MIYSDIRAMIQRLQVDDAFRRTFVKSPDLVLAQHGFSGEERRALLKLQARLATAGGPGQGDLGNGMPWP